MIAVAGTHASLSQQPEISNEEHRQLAATASLVEQCGALPSFTAAVATLKVLLHSNSTATAEIQSNTHHTHH